LTPQRKAFTVVRMAVRIAFVNGKGGVGKTTCSLLFAAALLDAGRSVSIDDRDPQGNATSAAIQLGIPQGNGGRNVVVVDTAPNLENPSTISAIKESDVVVLVTTPDAPDLSTTLATSRIIKEIRTGKTVLLFNRVVPHTYEFNEMPRVAAAFPFPTLPHHLTFLRAYPRAHLHGWKALQPNSRIAVIEVARDILLALDS
jgi:chromosome partitioning protein